MQAWSVWPVALPVASVAGAAGPHCQAVSAGAVGDGVAEGEADADAVADTDGAGEVDDGAGEFDDERVGDAEALRLADGFELPLGPGELPGPVPVGVPGAEEPACGEFPAAAAGERPGLAV